MVIPLSSEDVSNITVLQVLVPKDEMLLGKMVEVEIVSAGKHYLMGELVKEAKVQRPLDVPPPLEKGQVSGVKVTEGEEGVQVELLSHCNFHRLYFIF